MVNAFAVLLCSLFGALPPPAQAFRHRSKFPISSHQNWSTPVDESEDADSWIDAMYDAMMTERISLVGMEVTQEVDAWIDATFHTIMSKRDDVRQEDAEVAPSDTCQLAAGESRLTGCKTSCKCSSHQNCYPHYVQADGTDVGVCELNLWWMTACSFGVFFLTLMSILAFRFCLIIMDEEACRTMVKSTVQKRTTQIHLSMGGGKYSEHEGRHNDIFIPTVTFNEAHNEVVEVEGQHRQDSESVSARATLHRGGVLRPAGVDAAMALRLGD